MACRTASTTRFSSLSRSAWTSGVYSAAGGGGTSSRRLWFFGSCLRVRSCFFSSSQWAMRLVLALILGKARAGETLAPAHEGGAAPRLQQMAGSFAPDFGAGLVGCHRFGHGGLPYLATNKSGSVRRAGGSSSTSLPNRVLTSCSRRRPSALILPSSPQTTASSRAR